MKVLVTGGAGFIGSHTCLVLAEHGHEVVIVDSHVNSSPQVLARLAKVAGKPFLAYTLDLRDQAALAAVFAEHAFDAVIHFAALKAVGESCQQPLRYFDNNIGGSLSLLQAMQTAGVQRLVFSSSATVYGQADVMPIAEDAPLRVTNPYGRTKEVVEKLIADTAAAHPDFHAVSLRYFNPVGAHPSGEIGEDPNGVPENLMPYICRVAVGRLPQLRVFGSDWPTSDGTGVRDYLHVMDLARAHVAALDFLVRERRSLTANLGTGRGVSVLELVRAFEQASGQRIPYEIVGRRAGDVATLYADPSLAQAQLRWRAELSLADMCRDAWHWQSKNPRGFEC